MAGGSLGAASVRVHLWCCVTEPPWSSALWAPIARALSADHTVYLWDMPGYGASSMDPDHAVDLGLQGELLAHMLATWDLQRPHVVAHDYGGAVALRAHLLHGRPMASMFLVDVVALAPWGSEFFRLVRQHAEVFAALPAPIHRSVVRGYIAGASHRGLRPEELEMLCAPWLTGPGQAAFYRQMAEADQRYTDEFADRLDRIDAPVRVVWGREDHGSRLSRANASRPPSRAPRSALSRTPGISSSSTRRRSWRPSSPGGWRACAEHRHILLPTCRYSCAGWSASSRSRLSRSARAASASRPALTCAATEPRSISNCASLRSQ